MAEWITTEEAKQLSGYSIAHLQDLLRRKKIEAEKKGGAYWINRAALLIYMEEANAAQAKDRRHGARSKSKSSS